MLPNKLEIVKIESDFFLSGMFTVNKSSPGQKKKKKKKKTNSFLFSFQSV